MALPCPPSSISISQIRAEFGTSSGSLRYLSSLAGFGTPDAMSEFRCYSTTTSSTTPAPGACFSLPEIGRDPSSSNQACINQNNGSYVVVTANADGLLGATLLYRNCSTKPPAIAGWYADGARARYWTGSAFSGSPVQCII